MEVEWKWKPTCHCIYIYIIYINILQYIIYIQVHAPNSAKGVDFCRMAKVKHDV